MSLNIITCSFYSFMISYLIINVTIWSCLLPFKLLQTVGVAVVLASFLLISFIITIIMLITLQCLSLAMDNSNSFWQYSWQMFIEILVVSTTSNTVQKNGDACNFHSALVWKRIRSKLISSSINNMAVPCNLGLDFSSKVIITFCLIMSKIVFN